MTLVKHCDDGGCCDPDGLYRITHYYAHNHRHLPPFCSSDAIRGAERIGGAMKLYEADDGDDPRYDDSILAISCTDLWDTRVRVGDCICTATKKTTEKQRDGHVARAERSRAKRSGAVRISLILPLFLSFSPSL